LGFGFRYRRSHKYSIPDGQDVDVGFLKCFFPTSPVDLSKIPTSSVDLSNITTLSVDLSNIPTSSIDPSQTASSPVDLSKTAQHPPLRLRGGAVNHWRRVRLPESCVVIPVVQRRVKQQ
jgi:hypothetical protein